MPNLSQSAQVVLDAAIGAAESPDAEAIAAAALRAAAEQVVPLILEEELFCRNHSLPLQKMVEIRLQLLAIATELENYQ